MSSNCNDSSYNKITQITKTCVHDPETWFAMNRDHRIEIHNYEIANHLGEECILVWYRVIS